MAEGFLKRMLPGCTTRSAGLGALVGQPADPTARELMFADGIDISGHRANQLLSVDCMQADLILVMDMEQKHVLESRHMVSRGKIFRLGEFTRCDIADPYRKGRGDFEQCRDIVLDSVNDWVRRIRSQA